MLKNVGSLDRYPAPRFAVFDRENRSSINKLDRLSGMTASVSSDEPVDKIIPISCTKDVEVWSLIETFVEIVNE
jgi:hypothetical protein